MEVSRHWLKEVLIMKKIIIQLTLALLLCGGVSNAQLIKSYGFKLALTSASQNFEYSTPPWAWWTGSKTSAKIGFNIAAFVEWFDHPVFSVVSQIEYANRGTHLVYQLPGGTRSTDGSVNYLSIPILAKVVVPMGAVSPYFLVGPRADFLVGYQEFVVLLSGNPNYRDLLYSDFKKAMVGGSIGVGVQFDSLLPVSALVELRYNIDFIDSYDKNNLKVHNNAIDAWLGFAL
jgi:hypothetical protein